MMTDRCNLNCPYCFANEFVNKDSNDITREAFQEALSFLLGDGTNHSVGLIGGEPTTHPRFDELLRMAILDRRADTVVVYTNGLLIDRYIDLLTHEKVHLLINCNSPSVIGVEKYQKTVSNIDMLVNDRLRTEKIALGINLYGQSFEYEYIIDLLRRYNLNRLRVSITVPNESATRNNDAHDYFLEIKPRLLVFFEALLNLNIIPYFDCNKIPRCLISDEELNSFKRFLDNPTVRDAILKSNISSTIVRCSPVIDVLQDLTAVRCFGLSRTTRCEIKNFAGIADLKNYYIRSVDAYGFNTTYSSHCNDCYDRKTLRCEGGCLAFKEREIEQLSNLVDERLNDRHK